MWPWAHAALGYLLLTLYLRVRTGNRPAGAAVLLVGFGTQLPDLVDKPLAWYLHVLPYGRTLMHSLFLGGVAVALVALYLNRRGAPDLGVALVIGYYSHLLGDSYESILTGHWSHLAFLVWPLLPIPGADSEVEGLLAHLRNIRAEPFFLFGLFLTAIALAVWAHEEFPGLETLRGWLDAVPGSA